ncbi:MAG: TRASH domain-containing protein [Thermoplasmatales archaeon]
MTKINVTKNESKILRLLSENSRLSISELSSASGLNRNTVTKIINNLISKGIIENFTVKIRNPDEKLIMVETDDDSSVPEDDRIETIYLLDGKEIVLIPTTSLHKVSKYTRIGIVSKLSGPNDVLRSIKTYCDYCGKEIQGDPITFLFENHTYYACCENCRSDLMRLLRKKDKA